MKKVLLNFKIILVICFYEKNLCLCFFKIFFSDSVNEFRYWTSTNRKRAIWHIVDWDQWAIGDYDNLGTKFRGIRSSLYTRCPEEVTGTANSNGSWDYSFNSNWYHSGDKINVTCLDGMP